MEKSIIIGISLLGIYYIILSNKINKSKTIITNK